MRKLILLLFFLLGISFISCSRGEDVIEEYILEIERTKPDSSNKNDSNQNDSTISGKTDTDTITINKPSTDSTDNSASIKKDTIYISYEKYMSLSPSTNSVQGAACFDKYLFQGYGSNSRFEVYNLEAKVHLGKINISDPKPNSRIHANTLCFGNQRVSPDDFFPVLYVSSGYTTGIDGFACSYVYVYRIIKDDRENFSANLVQTITLKGFVAWTEGIPDNDNNLLWIKYQPNETYSYASFKMPKVEDGNVTLTESDIINNFSFVQPFKSSNQGHIYHDNKILLVSGTYPHIEKLAFIMINILTGKQELIVDLNEIGLSDEPESIFFYKENLMIGYRDSIYTFIIRNSSGDKLI